MAQLQSTNITGSLNVTSNITGSTLNLNDSQSNIIVSDQSPNLDSTSDNNIIIGLGAAQNMTGSFAERNIIIGTNAGKELSNTITRYNTIIGYNAFSDHSGSNSSQHTIIGYNAGLGMSSAGYPNSAVVIGANAKATDSFRSMAIGTRAQSGYNGHAIGYEAYAPSDGALAIGANSSAASSGVAIGQQSSAVASSIAIGRNVSSTNGAAVNIGSSGATYQGVLIGYSAQGTGNQGVAIGYQVGNRTFSVSIGYQAGKWNTGNSNVTIGRYAMLGVSGSTNVAQTVAIGESALQNITTGNFNTAVGYQALQDNTTGGSNTAVGYLALTNATTNTRNTAVGYGAFDEIDGTNNVSYSTGLGYGVNSGGHDRVIVIGHNVSAGGSNSISIGGTAGYQGTVIGNSAKNGRGISIGHSAGGLIQGNVDHNIFIGDQSGYNANGSRYNTFLGPFAGRNLSGGDNNVILGYNAGYSIGDGSDNIFLGYQAGYNETGSNKLYIANSDTTTPLIYGEFDNDLVRINGSLNVSSSLTASGLNYPTTDGTDRQVLKTDGNGNLSFGYAENVEIAVKNVSGGEIPKGTPCYITGSGTNGNIAGIIPADASNLALMPAGLIAGETIADGEEGVGLVNGFIQGVDTSLFASGDTVYIAVGGGYTNVKPTGSGVFIQKLGNVEKVASNGSGVINGPGYYNDLPNWETGKVMVGTDTYPATSSVIHLDEANGRVGIGTTSPIGRNGFNGGRLLEIYNDSSYSSINVTGNGSTFATLGAQNSGVDLRSSSVLRFATDGSSTKMTIDTSGNVGIGTTSPSSKLHIVGINDLANNYALKVQNLSGTDILVVENDGKVGIGTDTPQQKLQVEGGMRFASDGAGANYMELSRITNNQWKWDTSGVGAIMTQAGNLTTWLQDFKVERSGLIVAPTLGYAARAINIDHTWNSGTTNFTTIDIDVTDTASSGSSSFIDIAKGGTTGFIVDENFNVGINISTPRGKLDVSGSFLGSVTDITPTNQTASLDCSLGNFFTLTLSSSADTFLTASNIQPGQSINLRITQPSTSGSLSYGPEFKFPNGAPYAVSATGSVEDILSFIAFDASSLYGSSLKNFQ